MMDYTIQEERIEANENAIPFYEKLGFSAFGKEFMEDGLPHTQMLCKGKT